MKKSNELKRIERGKMDDFNKPVIPWQRITAKNQFCITKAGTIVLDSMAFLSCIDDYKYLLLAVLNSNLIYYWVKTNVHEYGNTGFRLSNQYVELISVPKIKDIDNVDLVNLVKKELNQHSDEVVKLINNYVYKLYNLSESEISIIENQ